MIQMLSIFDLKPGQDLQEFRAVYAEFVAELRAADIIVDAGPVGRRVSDTPMDTDDERTQQFMSTLTFRDRAQLDASYAHIEARLRPGTHEHINMHRRITNSIFLCWDETVPPETTLTVGDAS